MCDVHPLLPGPCAVGCSGGESFCYAARRWAFIVWSVKRHEDDTYFEKEGSYFISWALEPMWKAHSFKRAWYQMVRTRPWAGWGAQQGEKMDWATISSWVLIYFFWKWRALSSGPGSVCNLPCGLGLVTLLLTALISLPMLMEEGFCWIQSEISANVNVLGVCIPLDCLVFANHHGHHGHRDPGCGRKHFCGYGKHPEDFWSFLWGIESMADNGLRNVCFPFEKSDKWRLYGEPLILMKQNSEAQRKCNSLLSPFISNNTYVMRVMGTYLTTDLTSYTGI